MARPALVLVVLAGWALPARAAEPAIPSELTDYVNAPDKSFAWKLADKTEADAGTVYTLDLVSQTWHDVKWDHKLQVFVPKGAKPQATMVMWNQGGNPSFQSALVGMELAKAVKSPLAFLFGVPKQPLYGGKTEDALIAETFVKYLETKDGTWPLLFPMAKSVVRAMDAVQAFAREEWKFEVKDFVVTGASKRGWTSWLAAATGDRRVKAIAPLVIDTLNIPVQMDNQVKAFGRPSEMVKDYTNRGLIPIPKTDAAARLWQIIDPWTYRDRLTLPKLIVNGANDPYWPLDALNTYWDGLKGEKYLLYVPNAGHNLCERDKDGRAEQLPARTIATVAAFCRSQVFGTPMPKLAHEYADRADEICLRVGYEGTAKGQRLWTAEADSRDFRKARWTEQALTGAEAKREVGFRPPTKGYRASFVETEFEADGQRFNLSTPLRILEAPKK
ncbi:MAG: hypothetical protein C0501_26955 [Isosphaera sp.]|nr:hypothetical protein [Isosphaera sp.]